jgi:hypothetical protein
MPRRKGLRRSPSLGRQRLRYQDLSQKPKARARHKLEIYLMMIMMTTPLVLIAPTLQMIPLSLLKEVRNYQEKLLELLNLQI